MIIPDRRVVLYVLILGTQMLASPLKVKDIEYKMFGLYESKYDWGGD